MSFNQSEWARCKHWIEAAANTSPWPDKLAEIEQRLKDGKQFLYCTKNAAAVWEFAEFNGKTVLLVIHGGGDLSELLNEIEPALCYIAKEFGQEFIAGIGREGWKKPCQAKGYKFAWLMMSKEVH